jgi:phosphohistidine phosphatase SixA
VYLVRHAHAGNRSQWSGPDDERPISAKGRQQSSGVMALLADATITRVSSSPAARCTETVAPLAEAHGLTVVVDKQLAEGSEPRPCIQTVLDPSSDGLVLCSHGDLIPKIIRRLSADGMRTNDPNLSQKGSIWVLEVDDGKVVSGRYLPPLLA